MMARLWTLFGKTNTNNLSSRVRNWVVKREVLVLLLITLLGTILRAYYFLNIPPGLNQDEAAAGYEAYSLLITGADKWGNPLPVYFPGWGTGQNVLYSYLTIPWIILLGLTPLAVRMTSLILGILALPLFYWTVREHLGRTVALSSILFLAVLPWHVMLSRWGLESNLLPFFLLLGVYTYSRWIAKPQSFLWSILALVPWALALYAYGTAFIIVPILIALVFIASRRMSRIQLAPWTRPLASFGVLSFPAALFAFKNFIFRSETGLEDGLPFSALILPGQRLDQIGEPFTDRLTTNIHLLLNGFQDGLIWNQVPEIPPLPIIVYPFLIVGIISLIRRFLIFRQADPFLLWLSACLPLIFLIPLNINRANAAFIPIVAISVWGFFEIYRAIGVRWMQKAFGFAVAGWLVMHGVTFYLSYLYRYPDQAAADFNLGFDQALINSRRSARVDEKIVFSDSLRLPYVYVAFYLKMPPQEFRDNVRYQVSTDGVYQVSNVGRFYFEHKDDYFERGQSFIFVLRDWEGEPCSVPEAIFENRFWKVGRCVFES